MHDLNLACLLTLAGSDLHTWGHLKLRACLNKEPGGFPSRFHASPVLAQYSSVGNITPKWLEQFADSLCAGRCGDQKLHAPPGGWSGAGVHLVWPTVSEVQNSIEGWFAGGSIPGYPGWLRLIFGADELARRLQ